MVIDLRTVFVHIKNHTSYLYYQLYFLIKQLTINYYDIYFVRITSKETKNKSLVCREQVRISRRHLDTVHGGSPLHGAALLHGATLA